MAEFWNPTGHDQENVEQPSHGGEDRHGDPHDDHGGQDHQHEVPESSAAAVWVRRQGVPSLSSCWYLAGGPVDGAGAAAPAGVRHRLAVILGLAVCAVLAGARSFTAIAEWAADAVMARSVAARQRIGAVAVTAVGM